MLLWFAGLAFLITWQVFQSPAIDFRMVMVGSVVPLADLVVGGPTVLHTLLGSAFALAAVMVIARGRRLVQRRWVGIAIGMLLHLALDGAWSDGALFWWPFLVGDLSGSDLPELIRPTWIIAAMELVGAGSLLWCWRTFDLSDPQRRSRFIRTGQLDRSLRGCADRAQVQWPWDVRSSSCVVRTGRCLIGAHPERARSSPYPRGL